MGETRVSTFPQFPRGLGATRGAAASAGRNGGGGGGTGRKRAVVGCGLRTRCFFHDRLWGDLPKHGQSGARRRAGTTSRVLQAAWNSASGRDSSAGNNEIGRASCRERREWWVVGV